jgi:hypothetical protein
MGLAKMEGSRTSGRGGDRTPSLHQTSQAACDRQVATRSSAESGNGCRRLCQFVFRTGQDQVSSDALASEPIPPRSERILLQVPLTGALSSYPSSPMRQKTTQFRSAAASPAMPLPAGLKVPGTPYLFSDSGPKHRDGPEGPSWRPIKPRISTTYQESRLLYSPG